MNQEDASTLLASLALNPTDWGLRLRTAEALAAADRGPEALALLKQNVDAPISLADSRKVHDLTAKLEAEGVEAAPVDELLPTVEAAAEPALAVVAVDDGDDDEPVYVAAVADDGDDADGVPAQELVEHEGEHGYWEDGEHGRVFIVAEGGAVKPHEKESDAAAKVSALTTAILVHVAIAVLLGFAVIAMPRPPIPQVTATLSQPDTDQQVENMTVKRVSRSVSSSSAPTSFVVSSVAASPVSVPEFEGEQQKFDVTLGAVGANIGTGMSFAAEEEESMVNFFGIKSKGSRIVLVIEAARYMLTDTKGGIPAYDKVKEDIEKMLGGLNKTTAFNIVLFEGKKIASFRNELVAASPSNVRQAIEWIEPINKVYEEIGIREDYTTAPIQEGIEPIPVDDLFHYIKALQRALEMDVNTVFVLTSGWYHIHKPLDEREMEKFYRQQNWGEKEEAVWVKAVQDAQAWLDKENAARRAKGVPQRVLRDWHELVAELQPNVRRKPAPGYTMEEVEEQVKNAKEFYYRQANKKKPEINIVWFIGEDEEPNLNVDTHFKSVTHRDGGKMRILKGLEGLKNVTGDPK
ncbi:MAG: hypothetical protein KDN19_04945 [Verrucomicrobiae bacterium]|nr:hypothetical protein [Verrucomicrobiae bacterium]